uniref:WD repeat domain 86 n=1 Tax=Malurus cyaneus samueli TaxID=2593467 RepID=A0A8C5UJE0_9PASS
MGNSGSAVKVCTDHQGGINWLSLSPDGQRLLTGSEDGTARLWSTADSQCHGHFQGTASAAFTCSADHTIRKWDVVTGQCLAVYRGHTSIVNRWGPPLVFLSAVITHFVIPLQFPKVSRDLLVTGSTDCTVKVWWVSSGRCYQTLLGHTGAVLCLILDAPNRELFSGSTDYTIRTWNIVTGEQLKVFKEHQGSVICLEVRTEDSSTACGCLCLNSCGSQLGGGQADEARGELSHKHLSCTLIIHRKMLIVYLKRVHDGL